MKKANIQILSKSPLFIAAVALFAIVMTIILALTFAASGSATIYTSPGGNQTVTRGGTFNVSVRISSGSTHVAGADVYLTYPTDKIQVQGISYGNQYPYAGEETNSGGIVHMARGANVSPAPSGDNIFATITFITSTSGTAPIGIAANSVVISAEADANSGDPTIASTKSGVTYTISTPSPAPSPVSPAPPPTTITPTSTTSSTSSGSTTSRSSTTTSSSNVGSVSTASSNQLPPSSNPNPSDLDALATAPATLRLLILDQKKKPVEEARVTLNDVTVTTDGEGLATFNNPPVGRYEVMVEYKGKTVKKEIEISPVLGASDSQFFSVEIDNSSKLNPFLIILPLIALAGVIIVILFGRKLTFNMAKLGAIHPHGNSSASFPILTQNNANPTATTSPSDGVKSSIESIPYPDTPKPGLTVNPNRSEAPATTITPSEDGVHSQSNER